LQKVLTVVGRAENADDFVKTFFDYLPDNYDISGVHNLGEFYEADKKERYLAFITEEVFNDKSTTDVVARVLIGQQLGAYIHNSLEDAIEYAKKEYGFEDEGVEHEEQFAKMREKFPFFTASEIKQYKQFSAQFHSEDIVPFRCRFNDELAIALVTIANGHDEIQVSPFAVLLTEKMAEEFLSMPFEEED
jgi:hypothetical protein